jgi:hypothetical protein
MKPAAPDIQLLDEAIDHPNQRIAGHQRVQPLRKQRRLLPIHPLDIPRHQSLRRKITGASGESLSRHPGFYTA